MLISRETTEHWLKTKIIEWNSTDTCPNILPEAFNLFITLGKIANDPYIALLKNAISNKTNCPTTSAEWTEWCKEYRKRSDRFSYLCNGSKDLLLASWARLTLNNYDCVLVFPKCSSGRALIKVFRTWGIYAGPLEVSDIQNFNNGVMMGPDCLIKTISDTPLLWKKFKQNYIKTVTWAKTIYVDFGEFNLNELIFYKE